MQRSAIATERKPIEMPFTLEGKTAIVTGSGRGIGRAIAQRLSSAGACVMLNDLDSRMLQESRDTLTDPGRADFFAGDLTDPSVPGRIVEATLDTFKAVDELYSQADGPEMVQTLINHQVRYEYDNDNFFYSDTKPTIQVSTQSPRDRVLLARNPDLMRRIEHVFWSPPFVGNIDNSRSHGELVKFVQASKSFSDILEDPANVVEEKMDSGTCVIFDNQRVVHARNEFDVNSGKRWLKGAYLAHQDFSSKAVSLESEMPPAEED